MINFGKVDLDTLKIIVQSDKEITYKEREYVTDMLLEFFFDEESFITLLPPHINVTLIEVDGQKGVYDISGGGNDGDGEPMPENEDNVVDLPKKAGGGNVH